MFFFLYNKNKNFFRILLTLLIFNIIMFFEVNFKDITHKYVPDIIFGFHSIFTEPPRLLERRNIKTGMYLSDGEPFKELTFKDKVDLEIGTWL